EELMSRSLDFEEELAARAYEEELEARAYEEELEARAYEEELAARAFEEDLELWARDKQPGFWDRFKANKKLRQAADHEKEAKVEKASAAALLGTPATPPSYRREFDDNTLIASRDFIESVDELVERGLWSKVKNTFGAAKDAIKGKTATPPSSSPVMPPVDTSMTSDPNAVVMREFMDEEELTLRDFDELDARAFDDEYELFQRDVTEDFEARDFIDHEELAVRDFIEYVDELVERGLWSKVKNTFGAAKDAIKGGKTATPSSSSPVMPPVDTSMTSDPNAVVMREFMDEEELALRDFEEFDARGFDKESELFQRDLLEEFEARDFFEDALAARDFEIDELD
ncbi:hypothetical protein H0H87_009428, partial [Tephrocybe sp. NHM501043]